MWQQAARREILRDRSRENCGRNCHPGAQEVLKDCFSQKLQQELLIRDFLETVFRRNCDSHAGTSERQLFAEIWPGIVTQGIMRDSFVEIVAGIVTLRETVFPRNCSRNCHAGRFERKFFAEVVAGLSRKGL